MSTFFVTTNQTSTRTLGAGDAILIGRTGGISVPGDHAIEALGTDNATRAQIDGHVYGYASGVHMSGTSLGDGDYSGTGDHSVNIGAEGTVIGMGTTSGHAGVFMAGTGGTVVNHGSVSGVWNGITLHGAGGFVSNTGWVSGQSATGVELRGFDAVFMSYELVNSGVIDGPTGIARTGGLGSTRITNLGEITAQPGGAAVVVYGAATGASSLSLTNSGTITGGSSAIVTATLQAAAGEADDVLVNHGLILGDVALSIGDDRVVNDGQIDGLLDLGAGNDTLSGLGGSVSDSVLGGDGDDLFVIDQSDVVILGGAGTDEIRAYSDVVSGGGVEVISLLGGGAINATGDDESNTITGTSGANILVGGLGNDTMNGRAGIDELQGGGGADVLRGGAGGDVLSGGADGDVLAGQGGGDELDGGDGDDTMAGHAGDDVLIGGLGRDLLVGGVGADFLIFEDVAETSADLALSDRISGFVSGEDRIDLSAINEESFAFIGTDQFSAGGGMELRYFVNGVGHSIVQMDATGDGNADAAVLVLGVASLSASDFIL